MRTHGVFFVALSCLILVGCHAKKVQRASSPVRATPPDVLARVAEFSLCKNATFVERKSLDGGRELLVFEGGAISVDMIKKFQQELTASGWRSIGTRPFLLRKYPAQQESVYEKDGTEMAYWVGGSAGFALIGVTLPE